MSASLEALVTVLLPCVILVWGTGPHAGLRTLSLITSISNLKRVEMESLG